MKFNSDCKLINNDSKYMIYNETSKKYYHIDLYSAEFLERIQKGEAYTTEEEEMYIFYCKKGIIIDEKIPQEEVRQLSFNINRIIFMEFDINRFFDKRLNIPKLINRFSRTKINVILLLAACINVVALFSINFHAFREQHFTLIDLVKIYFIYFIITIFHELGHAIVCKVKTGYVGKCGCMLYFLIPTFFTDVTVMKTLRPKERKEIILAGVFNQVIVGSILALFILFSAYIGNTPSDLIEYCFLLNILMIVLNLFPLLKFDGYWRRCWLWCICYSSNPMIFLGLNNMLG